MPIKLHFFGLSNQVRGLPAFLIELYKGAAVPAGAFAVAAIVGLASRASYLPVVVPIGFHPVHNSTQPNRVSWGTSTSGQ